MSTTTTQRPPEPDIPVWADECRDGGSDIDGHYADVVRSVGTGSYDTGRDAVGFDINVLLQYAHAEGEWRPYEYDYIPRFDFWSRPKDLTIGQAEALANAILEEVARLRALGVTG